MKKFGFALIGLMSVAILYYLTAGSAQITQKAKTQLAEQLTTLQKNGFLIQERNSTENEDHFIITFNDPQKMMHYLKAQGREISLEDAKTLKGMQLGVDIKYLPDTYSALSLDLYPVALPQTLLASMTEEDKTLTTHIQSMLARKALLLHIDFNKMLSGFKGSFKDINETIEEKGEKVTIVAKEMTFKGSLTANKIQSFSQKIGVLSLDAGEALQAQVTQIEGSYLMTGKSPYDALSHYHTQAILLKAQPNFSLQLKAIDNETQNSVENGLLTSHIITKIAQSLIEIEQKRYEIKESLLDFQIENLDIATLEALQKSDPNDETHIRQLTQTLLSKGIIFTLKHFSAKKVVDNGVEMNGFEMNSSVVINKTFNMASASQNPLALLNAIQMQTNIRISNELYALTVQDPRAMLMMMMVPPATQHNSKVYHIEFSHGKLLVNGISF